MCSIGAENCYIAVDMLSIGVDSCVFLWVDMVYIGFDMLSIGFETVSMVLMSPITDITKAVDMPFVIAPFLTINMI